VGTVVRLGELLVRNLSGRYDVVWWVED